MQAVGYGFPRRPLLGSWVNRADGATYYRRELSRGLGTKVYHGSTKRRSNLGFVINRLGEQHRGSALRGAARLSYTGCDLRRFGRVYLV